MGGNWGWVSLLLTLLFFIGLEINGQCLYGLEIAIATQRLLDAIETEECDSHDISPTIAICQTEIDLSLPKQETVVQDGFGDIPSFAYGILDAIA